MGNTWRTQSQFYTQIIWEAWETHNTSQTTLNEDNLAIEESWQDFKVGNKIDCRDCRGKWYKVIIQHHKPAKQPLPETVATNKIQRKQKQSSYKLEAINIHFISKEEKHDEWIFISNDTICNCCSACSRANHTVAAPNAQTRYNSYNEVENYFNVRNINTTAASIGLINIGNSGWMSNIHCLGSIDHFRTYFVSGQYKLDINESDEFGCKGELAHEFAKLLSDVWSDDIHNSISPQSFKHILGKCYPNFNGCKLQ
eukprot:114652_1